MCGIYASISTGVATVPDNSLLSLLCNRGPDLCGHADAHSSAGCETAVSLSFTSTVLALRGGHVTAQPLKDPRTGSILCWNGEAWKIGQDAVKGNDGEDVVKLLAASISSSKIDSIKGVLEVMRSLSGPFAFVFFDQTHNLLYYGRDSLGRRSLLYNTEDVPEMIQFSSLATTATSSWKEVEADAIYMLALAEAPDSPLLSPIVGASPFQDVQFRAYKFTWVSADNVESSMLPFGTLNHSISIEDVGLGINSHSVRQLETHLKESIALRVLNIPIPPNQCSLGGAKLAILFSGGLDCTVLARIAHDLLPVDEQIDLLNVAFENPRVVSASQRGLNSKKNSTLARNFNGSADSITQHINEESLDVTNQSAYDLCPDRITGRNALKELRRTCPMRKWRFIEINVPFAEMTAHRPKIILLMYPHNTEMDLSIACALYFAARGMGLASSNVNEEPRTYVTQARVLLSGLGADELFGGYTRHATAFTRYGFKGLLGELEIDINRLGKRNLGRDDRIIANWGREARYPYLDESLVRWALSCPVREKCGFGSETGSAGMTPDIEPGKKVLRLLAWKLGMHVVAKEKKRAIQFGARTAKMETGRTKGTSLIV